MPDPARVAYDFDRESDEPVAERAAVRDGGPAASLDFDPEVLEEGLEDDGRGAVGITPLTPGQLRDAERALAADVVREEDEAFRLRRAREIPQEKANVARHALTARLDAIDRRLDGVEETLTDLLTWLRAIRAEVRAELAERREEAARRIPAGGGGGDGTIPSGGVE